MAQPKPNESDEEALLRKSYPEFNRRLLEKRDAILWQADIARTNLDEQVMGAPGDAADESVIDTSADYFLKLANNHQRELVEIRDAMDRMARGVYGICENCTLPIALERLRRLPYARYCIECQSARERTSNTHALPKL